MEHVLINLFTNAAYTMIDGGTLTVRSSLRAVCDARLGTDPRHSRGWQQGRLVERRDQSRQFIL